MALLTPIDRRFLRRLCQYFGLRGVRVVEANTPKHDISIAPDDDVPSIYIGPVWQRRRERSVDDGRLAFTHEGLHTWGYPHSEAMRRHGYYSKDRSRDKLSERVYDDIKRGTPRFDPRRFGLPPRGR